ncbi:MAG: type II secretion system protein N [Sphingobium sp.]
MTMWPQLSRRSKIALVLVGVIAAIALFPLRLALGLAGVGDGEVSARQVRGGIWWGRLEEAMLGPVSLGTVNAAVSPVQLFVGRVRLDLWRKEGLPSDISGAWTAGFNQRGIDDVTGSLPVGSIFAPLPLSTMEFEDVTVHFAGDTCAKAEGRVRARISGRYAGLNLSQGLSGAATCDGQAVLLPLMSQSGMEIVSLRIWRDGRYTAQLSVKGAGEGNAAALAAAGLSQSGQDYVLNLEGRM